jgi:hypothetical protein
MDEKIDLAGDRALTADLTGGDLPRFSCFGTKVPISPLGRFFYIGAKVGLGRR